MGPLALRLQPHQPHGWSGPAVAHLSYCWALVQTVAQKGILRNCNMWQVTCSPRTPTVS